MIFRGGADHIIHVLTVIAGVVLLLGLLGLTGNMDYRDAVLAEERYTTMVCDGHWPDYQHLSPQCE